MGQRIMVHLLNSQFISYLKCSIQMKMIDYPDYYQPVNDYCYCCYYLFIWYLCCIDHLKYESHHHYYYCLNTFIMYRGVMSLLEIILLTHLLYWICLIDYFDLACPAHFIHSLLYKKSTHQAEGKVELLRYKLNVRLTPKQKKMFFQIYNICQHLPPYLKTFRLVGIYYYYYYLFFPVELLKSFLMYLSLLT